MMKREIIINECHALFQEWLLVADLVRCCGSIVQNECDATQENLATFSDDVCNAIEQIKTTADRTLAYIQSKQHQEDDFAVIAGDFSKEEQEDFLHFVKHGAPF